jgi:hypothetical protein
MGWPKHAAAAINAIIHDEEIVVTWKLVFVYAMQATLRWRAAEAIAVRYQTGILRSVSRGSKGEPSTYPYLSPRPPQYRHSAHRTIDTNNIRKLVHESTYRFFALVTFRRIDRVVIFCNVQVQKMLIWKILLAFRTSVHMRLLVMDIVCIE